MPPVAQKRSSGNGPESARNAAIPPAPPAGKNLKQLKPASTPAWISLAVATPGSNGTGPSRPEFLAALRKRGIEHPLFVDCFAIPVGYLGEQEFAGRRIAMVLCNPAQGIRNDWVRRVDGLIVVLDMDSEEILEITDDSAVPVPQRKSVV